MAPPFHCQGSTASHAAMWHALGIRVGFAMAGTYLGAPGLLGGVDPLCKQGGEVVGFNS